MKVSLVAAVAQVDRHVRGWEKLYVDQTGVQDFTARDFLEKNPKCLLIYKTIHLQVIMQSIYK